MKLFDLEEYKKNPTRKVVTRDGLPVRIICTDAINTYPIVALVNDGKGEYTENYTPDGRFLEDDENILDLFFDVETKKGWVNVYRNVIGAIFFSTPYSTKEEAIDELYDDTNTRIDTIKVEWEE